MVTNHRRVHSKIGKEQKKADKKAKRQAIRIKMKRRNEAEKSASLTQNKKKKPERILFAYIDLTATNNKKKGADENREKKYDKRENE